MLFSRICKETAGKDKTNLIKPTMKTFFPIFNVKLTKAGSKYVKIKEQQK